MTSGLVPFSSVRCVMCSRVAGQVVRGIFICEGHTRANDRAHGLRCGECGGNLLVEPRSQSPRLWQRPLSDIELIPFVDIVEAPDCDTLSSGIPDEFVLFAGTAIRDFADAVAHHVGPPLAPCAVERFPDGEISVQLGRSVRGKEAFVIQSTSRPVTSATLDTGTSDCWTGLRLQP